MKRNGGIIRWELAFIPGAMMLGGVLAYILIDIAVRGLPA